MERRFSPMRRMSKVCAIHQPHYLPYLGYFDKMFRSDVFVFLDTVQFEKNGWQNRNKIRTPDGWQWLTVPVLKKEKGQRICDTQIDKTQVSWKRKHLRSIEQNYSKAKYFEEFWPELKKLYLETDTDGLSMFNMCIVEWFGFIFASEWRGEFMMASDYAGISDEPTERLVDLCQKFDCDTYFAGIGGQTYMNMNMFFDAGITVTWQRFKEREYKQCYTPFLPGMGCLDYLLNCGKQTPYFTNRVYDEVT